MTLPEAVAAGLAALRAGHAAKAAALLEPVALDASMEAQEDLTDIRARVLCLLAQACLVSERLDDATRLVRQAEVLTRRLGDAPGLGEVQQLRAEIDDAHRRAIEAAAVGQRLRKVADLPMSALLAVAEDSASAWLERAAATLEAERHDESEHAARQALAHADTADSPARVRVMARLALASAKPMSAEEHLHAAWAEADAHDEPALITAVARAARQAGIPIAQHRLTSAPARNACDSSSHDVLK